MLAGWLWEQLSILKFTVLLCYGSHAGLRVMVQIDIGNELLSSQQLARSLATMRAIWSNGMQTGRLLPIELRCTKAAIASCWGWDSLPAGNFLCMGRTSSSGSWLRGISKLWSSCLFNCKWEGKKPLKIIIKKSTETLPNKPLHVGWPWVCGVFACSCDIFTSVFIAI